MEVSWYLARRRGRKRGRCGHYGDSAIAPTALSASIEWQNRVFQEFPGILAGLRRMRLLMRLEVPGF